MNCDKVEKKAAGEYFPHVISEYQNPYQYPLVDPRYQLDAQATLTIGDLHSNTMVFIGILIKHGVIHISKADFDSLAFICLKVPHEISPEDIQTVVRILSFATINNAGELGTLNLLGDETGDRNDCSLWILLILQMLNLNGVKYVICFSNHGYELLYNYEKNEPFTGRCMSGIFIESLTALETLIQKGLIERDVINSMIESYYIPYLKIVDYSVGKDNKLTYYTHSYAGRSCFMGLAYELGLDNYEDFTDGTNEQRVEILEKIQSIFTEKAKEKLLHTLIQMDGADEDPEFWSETAKLIWGRTANWIGRHDDDRHVNGHDNTQPNEKNMVLLDNVFGKILFKFGIREQYQTYRALYTHENKQFDHWCFRYALNTIKNTILPYIKNTFPTHSLEALLDEKDIYSPFHIETLKFLLCSNDSFILWRQLSFDVNHLDKITTNLALRECIYLLHTMALLTENIVHLSMKLDNYKVFFQYLLLLKESNLPSLEDKIRHFLSLSTGLQNELYIILLEARHGNDLTENVYSSLYNLGEADMFRKRVFAQITNYINTILPLSFFSANWLKQEDIDALYLKLFITDSDEVKKEQSSPDYTQKVIRNVCKARVIEKIKEWLFQSEVGNNNEALKSHAENQLPERITELYEISVDRVYLHQKEINLFAKLLEFSVCEMKIPLDDSLLQFILEDENALKNIGVMWQWVFEINRCVIDDMLKDNFLSVFARGRGRLILSWFIFLRTTQVNQYLLLTSENYLLGVNLAYFDLLENGTLISYLINSKEELPRYLAELIALDNRDELNLGAIKAQIGYTGEDTSVSISTNNNFFFKAFWDAFDDLDSDTTNNFSIDLQ